ncbi:MAG: deaminase [Ilumatobacteraceae bacterium]
MVAAEIAPPFHAAMELAWDSFRAGSLGIGAVITLDGSTVVTGRNRLMETDPGDDVLAGTSVAHAEMNALAKLRWREHRGAELHLWTTLEPCLQCLGAIRLSEVTHVHVLAPDPIFRGIEEVRHLSPFLSARWPALEHREVDEWAVLALLFQTHVGVFWGASAPGWNEHLPQLAALASSLVSSSELLELAEAPVGVAAVAGQLWSRLGEALPEVAELAAVGSAASPGDAAGGPLGSVP